MLRRWRRRSPTPFRRGAFVAWGLSNGQWTPAQFAQKAKAYGYEWAALELDDFGGWQMWPDFRSACLQYGVIPGVWVTEGRNIQWAPADTRFAIAELEGPGDYDGIMHAEASGEIPPVPKAVVTNFNVPLTDAAGVPQPAAAQPLIDAGYFCLTEAYLGDNPNATPDRLNFRATQLGWPGKKASQPAFGVWNVPTSTYDPWKTWPGADYLAEYTLTGGSVGLMARRSRSPEEIHFWERKRAKLERMAA